MRFSYPAIFTKEDHRRSLRWDIIKCVLATVLTIFVFTQIIGLHYVPTGSMIPFIQRKDICVSYRLAYNSSPPQRGDVITFIHDGEPLVKRVIGLSGENISFMDGKVYIDGSQLDESDYLPRSVKTMSKKERIIWKV